MTMNFWLGAALLAASILVLFFQQPLGEILGIGVMALWMILGAAGIYMMGKDRDNDQNPPM